MQVKHTDPWGSACTQPSNLQAYPGGGQEQRTVRRTAARPGTVLSDETTEKSHSWITVDFWRQESQWNMAPQETLNSKSWNNQKTHQTWLTPCWVFRVPLRLIIWSLRTTFYLANFTADAHQGTDSVPSSAPTANWLGIRCSIPNGWHPQAFCFPSNRSLWTFTWKRKGTGFCISC